MEEILNSLHWILLAIIFGSLISFAHKWVPAIYLAKLGTLPLCSENWITTWSLVLWYVGFTLYLTGYVYQGLVIMVIAGAFDKLDGHVARAKKQCDFFRSRASADLGKWWDPLADKLRQLPVIVYLASLGAFLWLLVIPVVIVDVIGTFVREPFTKEPFTKYRIFVFIKNHLRQTEASSVGKAKSLFQVLAILMGAAFVQSILGSIFIPVAVLAIALPLGVLSVISRVKIHRDVDKVVDEVHSVFVTEKPSN